MLGNPLGGLPLRRKTTRIASVLAIGGLDPSAGAGLAADQRAIQAQGVHALLVATAVTAQGLMRAHSVVALTAPVVREQLVALEAEFRLKAIKLGMLANAAVVGEVLKLLDRHPEVPVIADPVLASTSGLPLIDPRGLRLFQRELMPRLQLLTPNLPELERLTGLQDGQSAIAALLATGPSAVLLKGGHDEHGAFVFDALFDRAGLRKRFRHARLAVDARGTGCALASAIAARMACGDALVAAVNCGERYVQSQLRRATYPTLAQKAVLPGLRPIKVGK